MGPQNDSDNQPERNGKVEVEDQKLVDVENLSSAEEKDDNNNFIDETPEPLNRQHIWNLTFCLLAWGFTVANVTMVVGTSAVLVLSLGGSNEITSMPLGTFFFGSSLVSWTVTPWIFPQWGRKRGFLAGIALSLVGTTVGAISVQTSTPGLYIISTFFFGMATGLGFALRFAAVEVVPRHWASRAVTLVVSGGVIAAFAGPEASGATKDSFGQDLTYMGVFLMTGVFNLCNMVCTLLVTFPDANGAAKTTKSTLSATSSESDSPSCPTLLSITDLGRMMTNREFVVPMLIASGGWACMGMPMSLVRVVMKQIGYTSTESLRVIELHFLGMYAPGFFTGIFIQSLGAQRVCYLSVVVFAIAETISFFPSKDESDSILLWSLGLVLIGMAWNFAFTASTVWVLQKSQPEHKARTQAANDCLMFFFAGGWLFASSYIFEAGGSGMEGWYTLNWVVVGVVGCMLMLLVLNSWMEHRGTSSSSSSCTIKGGCSC